MPFGSKDRGEAGELLIKIVSFVLEELIATPTNTGEEPAPITKFHGLRAPSIAVSDYLVRISKFSGCSVSSHILLLFRQGLTDTLLGRMFRFSFNLY